MSYADDGYLVVPGFVDAATCAALIARAEAIAAEQAPSGPRSVFTTADQGRSSDEWFFGSGDRIRCFFEPEAFAADGSFTRAPAEALNKIGHALHDLDPVFDRFSHGPELASLAADLGLVQPQLWQSMVIFKQPGIGGEVHWHQDATFLHSEPMTVTGFWIALEDASIHNGCLWVAPGAHRGPLRKRFVRSGDVMRFVDLDATPWPALADAVPLEVPAGTLVCFHGLLPHYSAPNRSAQSRHAYTLHAIDARSRWSADNWLRRAVPPRGF